MSTRYGLPVQKPAAQHLNILLAEDNLINQKLAVRLLEKRGHTVTVAHNGREALDTLEKMPFDLVMMDVQMPEMDGFQATIELRRRERGSGGRIPVVAMTALAMKGGQGAVPARRYGCLSVQADSAGGTRSGAGIVYIERDCKTRQSWGRSADWLRQPGSAVAACGRR